MIMERNLTCIVCPRGCTLKISLDEAGKPVKIEGNACKRGLTYAEDECNHPRRTVTSTVRVKGGSVIPVKTSATVPKELVFDVMREINSYVASDKVKLGDVIIHSVLGTGADVVVTGNLVENA